MSPACTGAWIETIACFVGFTKQIGRPLVRGRGLKPIIPRKTYPARRRPLVRGRGLKLLYCRYIFCFSGSPACTGACFASAGRPLVRGRGLKRLNSEKALSEKSRPLVRGRGLKQIIFLIRSGAERSPACTGAWIETNPNHCK